MYKFIIHNKQIETEYLQLFSHSSWNDKANAYNTIVQKYSCLSFLKDVGYKDLLVMSFDKLVSIYYDYLEVEKDISSEDVEELHKCFPYNNHSDDKIIPFIERYTHHSESTTCPYCDCVGINIYQRYNAHRNYHLDHFLDKGKCPLVALSLYNLIPVCPACNTEKGANTFGNNKETTVMLSPFNPKYDFVNQIPITVAPLNKKDILKIRSSETLKKYIISMDFDKAPIYKQEVEITKIMERFYGDTNSNEHAAMIELYRNIVDKQPAYSRLDAKVRSQKLCDDFYLPSVEKHRKGVRRLYDKFIRDTIKQYTK